MVFTITAEELSKVNELREVSLLEEKGGVDGIIRALDTDPRNGIPSDEKEDNYEERVRAFGKNVYPQKPSKSLIVLFFNALKDPLLIVLMIVAMISIVLGVVFPEREEDRSLGWIEGFAINLAVLIVSVVASVNDWSKERQFRALNKASAEIEIKTIRGGQSQNILISELLVGDIVTLDAGDQVPADGIVVESMDLSIDESVMTGETDLVKKNKTTKPFLLSGCHVSEGGGTMLVTAVGVNSEWGKTLLRLSEDDDEKTPLAQKLDRLAGLIGQVGVLFAVLTFLALLFVWLVQKVIAVTDGKEHFSWANLGEIVKFIIIGITIIVVAVPEGLPLAVTISLAYSVRKMMNDNNLVRHLSACETMGGATNICSDKTGTLTLNQMRVVSGWFAGKPYLEELPTRDDFDKSTLDILAESIAINSRAKLIPHEDKNKEFQVQGNKTEGALLVLVEKNFEIPYQPIRDRIEGSNGIEKMFTFSSQKKRMSCIIKVDESNNKYRMYTKGASEIILSLCKSYLQADGTTMPLTDDDRHNLNDQIISMADRGLRTLCLSYKDISKTGQEWDSQDVLEQDMVCYAIVGIKDPVRPEVPQAVADCKSAGIFVRMVTGDNIRTAKHIARECGILDDEGIAMEGPEFRQLTVQELDETLPKLQVLARSSPDDKYKLVKRLRELHQVVAVTGDGTNDAPALKEADVGLSMGLSGTQVAKEASDIVILDDNFQSIVKSVMWGRSVFENIRKFLQFQLTVNVVALLLTVITAFTTFVKPQDLVPAGTTIPAQVIRLEPPLTAVQLLWVNLIMDTFAALALATEPPHPNLLQRKPYGKFESLVTSSMWISLLTQGLYQLTVLLFLYYGGIFFGLTSTNSSHFFEQNNTMVFNTFVLCQIFNEFNSRKINNEFNVFGNLHRSPMFVIILIITIGTQALIVFFGGRLVQTVPITLIQWVVSIAFGLFSIPLSLFTRIIVRSLLYLKERMQVIRERTEIQDSLLRSV